MTFEYMKEVRFQDTIDIEDIGNFVLEAINDDGDQWYFAVTTTLGYSTVIQCSGLTADSNEIPFSFSFSYYKLEYNEKHLVKAIKKFITDDAKNITQIFFSNMDALKDRLKNLEECKIIYG